MRNFFLSLLMLSLFSFVPALAQEPSAPTSAPTVNVERHVDIQTPSPSGGVQVDQQTMWWVGGLIGVVVLLGLVAMASRGTGENVTVVRD